MPMAARADFSEKYLTPESGLPKAHNLSSVLAFSNGQSPGASFARFWRCVPFAEDSACLRARLNLEPRP